MYIEDLGQYRYNGRFPLPGVCAVGWLSPAYAFPAEQLRLVGFLDKLTRLAAQKHVNQTRGFHRCEFCTQAEIGVESGGVERLLGAAEIWVPGPNKLFAAPDLVVHYVRDHRYVPPPTFVDAVTTLDLATWNPPRDLGLALYRRSLESPEPVNSNGTELPADVGDRWK